MESSMKIAAAVGHMLAEVQHEGLPWAPPEIPGHRSGLSEGDPFRHLDPPCFLSYADYEGDPFTMAPWVTHENGTKSRAAGGGRGRGGMDPKDRDCDGAGDAD